MRIDGALGFFQETSPPNNKKISSDWGPVPGPKMKEPGKTLEGENLYGEVTELYVSGNMHRANLPPVLPKIMLPQILQ